MKLNQSPRFVFSRFKLKIYELKHPDEPWMTSESIKLLDRLILSTDIGIEFGSGRSTFWLAQRCKFLYSIEHDKNWFSIVEKKLALLPKLNVNLKLMNLGGDPIKSDYGRAIFDFADSNFDFVVVDGKYRDLVSLSSIDKLKNGGLLILDDAERYLPNNLNLNSSICDERETSDTWKEFINRTSKWRQIWTNNGVSSTLIMIKSF